MNYRLLPLLTIFLLSLTFHSTAQTADSKTNTNITISIDTILFPTIGDIKQAVQIETDDLSKPILLFLSGGPGSSMIKQAPAFSNLLAVHFTLVHWDQRDAGITLKMNPSPIKPTVSQMKEDTYQVVKFVTEELQQEKIYLLGSSWGNVLGFHIVEKHPELLHAYLAVNPVISQLASEIELLEILKAHFKDNDAATEELGKINIPFQIDDDLFYLRKWLFYKDGKDYVESEEFREGFLNWSETWSPVWNEVMNIDLPKTLTEVECPLFFFVGKNDIQTSTKITEDYFDNLIAPKKGLFMFEESGHQIHHDEPANFQKTIIKTLSDIEAWK